MTPITKFIYETESKNSRSAQTIIFSPELTMQKLKGLSVLVFSTFVYLPFIAFLSLFFSLLHGLEVVFRSCEIKVHMADTVLINLVIYVKTASVFNRNIDSLVWSFTLSKMQKQNCSFRVFLEVDEKMK